METIFVGTSKDGGLQYETLGQVDLESDGAFKALSTRHGAGLAETILRTSLLAKDLACVVGTYVSENLLVLASYPVFPDRYREVVDQQITSSACKASEEIKELNVVISVSESVPPDQVANLEAGAIRCVLRALGDRFAITLFLTQAHGLNILTREVGTEEILQLLGDDQVVPPRTAGKA